MVSSSPISESLLERVLPGLGFSARPELTLEGLKAIYAAWGQRVPFDNVRKLAHLQRKDSAPFPGTDADDFFEAWLRHRAGGTCWAGSNALYSLLTALGFETERGIATMLAAPSLPPNHGSVRVLLDGGLYLVDTAILCGEPLRLDGASELAVSHGAWGVAWRDPRRVLVSALAAARCSRAAPSPGPFALSMATTRSTAKSTASPSA